MNLMNKIACNRIKEGLSFTDDLYFDDGENLFLSKNKAVKPYHVYCLKRWAVPFLLSNGHEILPGEKTSFAGSKKDKVEFESVNLGDFGLDDDSSSEVTSVTSAGSFAVTNSRAATGGANLSNASSTVAGARANPASYSIISDSDDVEELEELEELDDAEELEEL